MRAAINETIKTTEDVKSDFSDTIIPAGTIGTIVECYTQPEEGYSVDLAIPNSTLVGEYSYENVILYPDQFITVNSITAQS